MDGRCWAQSAVSPTRVNIAGDQILYNKDLTLYNILLYKSSSRCQANPKERESRTVYSTSYHVESIRITIMTIYIRDTMTQHIPCTSNKNAFNKYGHLQLSYSETRIVSPKMKMLILHRGRPCFYVTRWDLCVAIEKLKYRLITQLIIVQN